jgi:hypothetical protein
VFPARGSVPVARGNVWTREGGAAPAAPARAPAAPQAGGLKRPREDEAAGEDARPATQPKPALPELQDTLSRKLQEVRAPLRAACRSALTATAQRAQAEALRLRIELEAQRVEQRKARLEAEQERARAAQAAAQEAEQRERSRKLQSGFAAVRCGVRSSTRPR